MCLCDQYFKSAFGQKLKKRSVVKNKQFSVLKALYLAKNHSRSSQISRVLQKVYPSRTKLAKWSLDFSMELELVKNVCPSPVFPPTVLNFES